MKNKNKKAKAFWLGIFFFFMFFSFSGKVQAFSINYDGFSGGTDNFTMNFGGTIYANSYGNFEYGYSQNVAVGGSVDTLASCQYVGVISSDTNNNLTLGFPRTVLGDNIYFCLRAIGDTLWRDYVHFKKIGTPWVYVDSTFFSSTFSQFTQQTPVSGYITPTTQVVFSSTYYFNGANDLDIVGIEIRNLTLGQQLIPFEENIGTSDSYNIFYATTTLTSKNQYFWRPYLKNASSTEFIRGTWNLLYIEENTNESSFDPNLVATTTPSDFTNFLNLGNLLSTKIPFAYVYQIGILLINLQNSTSTSVAPIGQIPINLGQGTSTLTVFSTSTVKMFFSDSQISLLRGIMVFILWVSFALVVWRKIHNIHLA